MENNRPKHHPNQGLMEDVFMLIKKSPGVTVKQISVLAGQLKVDGKLKYADVGNSVSSSVSQMVKRGEVHYKEGPITKETGKKIFQCYPGKGPKLVGANAGAHKGVRKRKGRAYGVVNYPKANEPIVYPQFGVKAKPAPIGAIKVDVQVLIAIGDKDTLVGFETARVLYNHLKDIFEK